MKLFSHRHSQSFNQQPKEEAVRIAVVDTETTGLYNSDRIVEVGIVLLDPHTGAIVDEFETLVNPGRDVGPTRIHGITASMVMTAPHFDEIVSDIADRINGSILSAHNLSFDARMLGLEFSRTGATFEPGRGLCTLTMSQMRLDLACEEYGIKRKTAHRALDDARAASQLLMISLNSDAKDVISSGCEPARISLPPISLTTHGVPVTRDDVPQEREVSRLQQAHRLELACDDLALLPYLDLLGMALDDLVLTEQEVHELKDEAVRLGLDSNQIGLAHELAYASLAAGIELGNLMVERQLIKVLAPRLGINEQGRPRTPADQRGFEMIPAVCFTGDIFIRGRFVEREELEELTLAAGWSVEPTVTKKRCTLLVGDLNSHSLKMQKARQFGVEIASGDQFAALIGLSSLPPDGMVLPRDPAAFPLVGSQPDELDPFSAERGAASITINPVVPTGLQGRLATAVAKLEHINGFPSDSTEWDEACDQWEAGSFRGAKGLARLHHILEVFLAEEDEQAPEVALKIAEVMRDGPKHSHEGTIQAYVSALAISQTFPFDDAEERQWAVQEVVSEYADYLADCQDIDSLADLVRSVGSDNDLIGYMGVRNLVHRMRTGGQVDAAIAAAETLSTSVADVGAKTEAADICAEWVQALADSGRSTDAIEVCERAHASGWVSRDLANRHSLILERAKDSIGAIEMCNQGLSIAPGDEQLSKRRDRCLKRLSSHQ